MNARLVPTQNYDRVRNSKFIVVDAQERVLGGAVSEQEMEAIRRQGLREERIVWDFGVEKPMPVKNLPPKVETKVMVDSLKTTYRSPPIEEYKSR